MALACHITHCCHEYGPYTDFKHYSDDMKITGGTFRGRQIQVANRSDLRPSQGRVREAIFNILNDVSGKLVLDLFAGTGILGIEALSRGAEYADFVEKDPRGCKELNETIRAFELDDRVDIYCDRAEAVLSQSRTQTYDLIFLDPPYKHTIQALLDGLNNALAMDGQLVYLHGTHPESQITAEVYAQHGLNLIDKRKYGDTLVDFVAKSSNIQTE